MSRSPQKPRIALVSPFLDKKHGTERCTLEWISRLTDEFDIHIYSQRVEDQDLKTVTWHKIPTLPGPHLFNYVWWFVANQLWRAWDVHVRGLRYGLVFSPGINCLDADVISVYIVFAQYTSNLHAALSLRNNPVAAWPLVIHRRLYYKLIMALERRIYTRPDVQLVFIARRTAKEIGKFYGPRESAPVLYMGRDYSVFHSHRREKLRDQARAELGLADDEFALLLVGNDWRNKGVPVLLAAMELLRGLRITLLLVSREDFEPVRQMAQERNVVERVRLLKPRADVEFYYAAADSYVGPSLEDTFGLPPGEAMASGLPVIVSVENGASEIIRHEIDGLILDDPRDAQKLAGLIRRLYEVPEFAAELGENGERTAKQFTWEGNVRDLSAVFHKILRQRGYPAAQKVPLES